MWFFFTSTDFCDRMILNYAFEVAAEYADMGFLKIKQCLSDNNEDLLYECIERLDEKYSNLLE